MSADPYAPPESEQLAAPSPRWINTVVLVCAGAMLLDILVGVIVHYATGTFPLLPVLGVFLILSGLRLVAIAIDTVQRIRLRAVVGDGDRLSHGWGWVVYKSVAALIAFGGAAYVLLSPEASKLERIFG
ncbi:MAG: hypothetical protein H0X45_03665 [Planctomycetes bacterium]|nr:hypothetical protein [Planctomycetota bacterium]